MREEATTPGQFLPLPPAIVALRDERGSYNTQAQMAANSIIVALRDERGSYNYKEPRQNAQNIVALRDERGSYNWYLYG